MSEGVVKATEGDRSWVQQLVSSAFNAHQSEGTMARHKLEPPADILQFIELSRQALFEPEHSLVQCKPAQGNSCLRIT